MLNSSKTKCPYCGGIGLICTDKEKNTYKVCICVKNKVMIERLEKSGLTIYAMKKTFKTFDASVSPEAQRMKDIASGFAIRLPELLKSKDKHNSLALLGQSGAGKTHLLIAVVNILFKQDIDIQYFSYPEVMTYLKQNKMDEKYLNEVNKYKKCKLLIIDDLFKNGCSDSDKEILFGIINHRILNGKPFAISSEFTIQGLCKIDEAFAGRIKEATDRFRFEIVGSQHNYRLSH